ncbi:MAG TPA: acyltransferase [bacterium]|nr:acyltransferase [bacterium]
MSFEFTNIYVLAEIAILYILLNLKTLKNLKKKDNIEENKLNSRINFFDFTKGLAILAAFIGHIVLIYKNNLGELYFFIVKLCRFAIPFFIISSGCLLYLKDYSKESIKNFYKKKVVRLIIPYLIVCIFLFILKKYTFNLTNIIKIFDGKISAPFYFMPILIQAYIFYPIINKIIDKIGNKKSLILSFIISFISIILIPTIYDFHTFLPYLFFFVFGIIFRKNYYIYDFKYILKKINFEKFSLIIFIIYFLFSIIEKNEEYSNFQLIYAPTLFILLFYVNDNIKNKKIYKSFSFFGRNSLYIFLLHFEILQSLYKYFNNLNINYHFKNILFILVSFIIAFLLPAMLSEKIKDYLQQQRHSRTPTLD